MLRTPKRSGGSNWVDADLDVEAAATASAASPPIVVMATATVVPATVVSPAGMSRDGSPRRPRAPPGDPPYSPPPSQMPWLPRERPPPPSDGGVDSERKAKSSGLSTATTHRQCLKARFMSSPSTQDEIDFEAEGFEV